MNALVVVDVQNDFLPGGALAVPDGDEVVPLANALAERFEIVVASQDWHPHDHASFAAQHPGREPGDVIDLDGLEQTLWPVHCVQGSRGAEFAPGLRVERFARVFRKGCEREIDSYSAFFDNGHRRATGLGDWLRARGVERVVLAGLATDWCVRFTALDARELGFEATLIEDACRGVELRRGDVERALAEMRGAGVGVETSAAWLG